jgi:hypothetical protein
MSDIGCLHKSKLTGHKVSISTTGNDGIVLTLWPEYLWHFEIHGEAVMAILQNAEL